MSSLSYRIGNYWKIDSLDIWIKHLWAVFAMFPTVCVGIVFLSWSQNGPFFLTLYSIQAVEHTSAFVSKVVQDFLLLCFDSYLL